MKRITEAINKACKPIIYAGHGCTLNRPIFNWFIETLQMPVMLSWRAIDLLSDDHPLFAGRPGLIAQPDANKRLMGADLLLIIGARMDDSLTCYNIRNFAPKAVKIVVDCDEGELDRLPDDWITVNMDATEFMRELVEALG